MESNWIEKIATSEPETPKRFEIFIIDAKSKVIAKHFSTYWISTEATTGEVILPSCNKVYKTIKKKAKHDIERILRKHCYNCAKMKGQKTFQ